MVLKLAATLPPHRLLALTVLTSVLAACGGGGGDSTSTPSTTFTVSTSAGEGGTISPTSMTVNEGAAASFTVTAESRYEIDNVAGCGGSMTGDTYTTGNITADCTVSASFAPTVPILIVANSAIREGNSGTQVLTFTVALSQQAEGHVTVDYATDDLTAAGGASCAGGTDYVSASGTLTVASGTTSNTIDVEVCGENDLETNERFALNLTNASANVILGTETATGTIFNDESGALNDTGITGCGDYAWEEGSRNHDGDLDCELAGTTDSDGDPVPAGQDAQYGRDAQALAGSLAKQGGGEVGFDFTKIGSDGVPLTIQDAAWDDAGSEAAGTRWACVQDNVTGLMWEVKTTDGGLHDRGWTYSWYNPDDATNGGDVGTAGGGQCGGTVAAGCDTENFALAVSAGGLCGYGDWRMPSTDELLSIAHLGGGMPTIDEAFFPNTVSSEYWSSAPHMDGAGSAWYFDFGYGTDGWFRTYDIYRVRLVREGW